MAEESIRRALLFRTAMEILRDAGTKVPPVQVLEELRRKVSLTPYELSIDKSGLPRYERAVGFSTGDAATVGWASKIGGWSITEAGIEALETYPTADELFFEQNDRYHEIDQRRKQAQQNLSEVQQFIATTLRLVDAGSWTAQDDLADLAGTTAREVADFLASGKVRLINAYRVLNADGSIPDEGMLNAAYRGTDLRSRLGEEGIVFDAYGRATQDGRLTAESLKELLAERAD